MKNIQAVKGMHDILPDQTPVWRYVEQVLREVSAGYGYQEIRFPLVEYTELFARGVGKVTDIVEKEMYTFADRDGDSLTLRPEGTAGCVRAGIENGLFYHQVQRFWYMGPIFRHERPQRGRYRQFHQFGAEAFGMQDPDIDVEMILMATRFWKRLGLSEQLVLQLNSLGTAETRAAYCEKLIDYFSDHLDQLDEDGRRRLHTNPLRILDSKNSDIKTLIVNAPKLIDMLDESSREHFSQVCKMLDEVGVSYEINPCLVRGLDYYSHTVFEWITDKLGAQGAVCAGGRFNDLVEQLGGHATPAIGFAMGLERLIDLLSQLKLLPEKFLQPHAYFVMVGDKVEQSGLIIAEKLRDALPALRLTTHCSGGGFKSQFKKADKSGAVVAIILGEQELNTGVAAIKYLREDRQQQTIPLEELADVLKEIFGEG